MCLLSNGIFRNSDSIVTVQRLFHRKFNVECRTIPDRNTILWSVEAFRTTGYVMKGKPSGLSHSVRTPANVDTVRRAFLASPRHTTRCQALALGMNDWMNKWMYKRWAFLALAPWPTVICCVYTFDYPLSNPALWMKRRILYVGT
jgi:hypothetical protein